MTDLDRFDPGYLVTLDEIYHSHWVARKKRRIDRLRAAVAHFWPAGHPTKLVQVSGTNGKGSVAHYLEQGLRFAGGTGSWTGPHVFDYAERFHLDGEPVARSEIVDVYRRELVPYLDRLRAHGDAAGFAELGILIALHLLARRGARWGLLESGVGGRYTPLMALPMTACVVTNVGDDHPLSLGTELWQRALDKAGIARPGVPLFTAAHGEALEYVRRTAEEAGASVHVVGDAELDAAALELEQVDRRCTGFELANLTLALKLIRHFHVRRPAGEILASMGARLPGRFATPDPRVLVDVAHNRDKIARFAERLQLIHPGRKFLFLVGLTRKRDAVDVFEPLFELADEIVVTGASYAGQDPEAVATRLRTAFSPVSAIADPRRAYQGVYERLGDDQILVLTGSAYMIDQALNPDPYVRHTNASFGWRARIEDRG